MLEPRRLLCPVRPCMARVRGVVIARETAVMGAPGQLSRVPVEWLYRVMAYKDEYEVARPHAAATYGEKPDFDMSPPLGRGV